MATRALYASTQGIIRAKQAIARKRWTQQDLAYEVGLKTRAATEIVNRVQWRLHSLTLKAIGQLA